MRHVTFLQCLHSTIEPSLTAVTRMSFEHFGQGKSYSTVRLTCKSGPLTTDGMSDIGSQYYFFFRSTLIPSSVILCSASRSNLRAWVNNVRRNPEETSLSLMTLAKLAIVVDLRAIRTSG